jgi:hypothetical protein
MEAKLGGLAALTFKYSKNVTSENQNSKDMAEISKCFPSFSETTQIVFYNQVEKKFTLDEIHELVLDAGVKACAQAVTFLVRCTSGSKITKPMTSSKKK